MRYVFLKNPCPFHLLLVNPKDRFDYTEGTNLQVLELYRILSNRFVASRRKTDEMGQQQKNFYSDISNLPLADRTFQPGLPDGLFSNQKIPI
jgi:hypothetical protein